MCDPAFNPVLVRDPAHATDVTPPGPVTASGVAQRDQICGTISQVVLTVAAEDDATPAEQLGYAVSLAAGRLPAGMTLPSEPLVPLGPGLLLFQFSDDGALQFSLDVHAVDLNGNAGPATTVEVVAGEGGGCAVAGSGAAGAGAAVGIGLALLVALVRGAGYNRAPSKRRNQTHMHLTTSVVNP